MKIVTNTIEQLNDAYIKIEKRYKEELKKEILSPTEFKNKFKNSICQKFHFTSELFDFIFLCVASKVAEEYRKTGKII